MFKSVSDSVSSFTSSFLTSIVSTQTAELHHWTFKVWKFSLTDMLLCNWECVWGVGCVWGGGDVTVRMRPTEGGRSWWTVGCFYPVASLSCSDRHFQHTAGVCLRSQCGAQKWAFGVGNSKANTPPSERKPGEMLCFSFCGAHVSSAPPADPCPLSAVMNTFSSRVI